LDDDNIFFRFFFGFCFFSFYGREVIFIVPKRLVCIEN